MTIATPQTAATAPSRRDEVDALMRLLAALPQLPRPTPAGEALLRLFR